MGARGTSAGKGSLGIRLTGTPHDLASLRTLVSGSIDLVSSLWTELTCPEHSGAIVVSDRLDLPEAERLYTLGVDVVRLHREGVACRVESFVEGVPVEAWVGVTERAAATLAEAIAPTSVAGDPTVDFACFRVPAASPSATQLLGRLLALGRDDATVCELDAQGVRLLVVQLARPPAYLLMRSRDEPAEGVVAYARVGDGNLWVQWGYAHPLAASISHAIKATATSVWIDGPGRWHKGPAPLHGRSVYDVLIPDFEAVRTTLVAVPGESRFRVRLRLVPGPVTEAELWLLDVRQFMALEPLIETLSPRETERFTVARTMAPGAIEATYLLQELVRANTPRLGTRVSDLLGVAGYARAPGTDNLYLPVDRRLVPPMRRDELRSMLGLDQARTVVITEDTDGPRVVTVGAVDDVPLTQWVDYVATDRRAELDRLTEDTVFALLDVAVQKPPRDETARGSKADEAPRPPKRPHARPPPRPVEESLPVVVETPSDDGLAAVREAIRALEHEVARGGCTAADTWRELAALKVRVGDLEEASVCLEAALFHIADGEEANGALASQLADLRGRAVSARGTHDETLEIALQPALGAGEASYLGAQVVASVHRDEALDEALLQHATRLFVDPDLPVSRRLAWLVEWTVMQRAGDRLGLTRAKERLIGSLNDRGLSESYDLPRFVRVALALGSDDATAPSGVHPDSALRERTDQISLMEGIWRQAEARHVRELEPRGAYIRLIFAVGFMRLGLPARARELIEPVEREFSVHEPTNQALFSVYIARAAHIATQGDATAWTREVQSRVNALKDPRVRDRFEWLRKQSGWLRTEAVADDPSRYKPQLERDLAEAEHDPSSLAPTLRRVMDRQYGDLYDFELAGAIDRLLSVALRSGNDDVLADTLSVATANVSSRITILNHRALAIGSCLRAAAALSDTETIARLLADIVTLIEAPETASMPNILAAVRPGLAALRRLGVVDSARDFLAALVPVAARSEAGGAELRAALADGFMLLGERATADAMLDQALDDALSGRLDYGQRYNAGAAVLGSLRHWPMADRAPRCERLIIGLDAFVDTFTASTRKLYETYKVLLLERLVDTVVDDVTVRSDRVRGYLEAEELVVRRRILADWRTLCGP